MVDGPTFWTAAGVIVTLMIFIFTRLLDRRKEKGAEIEISVEGASWVLERGNDYEELLRLLLSLDYAALIGLTDSAAGTADLKARVFEKSQDSWSLVVFRDTLIVGYWSFFSLSSNLIERLERGMMFDSELVESEVYSLNEKRVHSLYVEMFGIHPAFKHSERRIFRMLLGSLRDCVLRIKEADIAIDAVYATGFSEKGVSLCKGFGLAPIVKSEQGGQVYCTRDIFVLFQRIEKLASNRSSAFPSRALPSLSE